MALKAIFDTSRRDDVTPTIAAERVAEERLMEARTRNGDQVADSAPAQ